jgi:hypothetical protein
MSETEQKVPITDSPQQWNLIGHHALSHEAAGKNRKKMNYISINALRNLCENMQQHAELSSNR